MWTLAVLLILSAALVLFADSLVDKLLYVTRVSLSKRTKQIPGPWWKWPLVGHRPLVKSKGGFGPATLSLSKEYESEVVGLYLSGALAVTACTPKTVYEVLTKPEFQGRPSNFFTYLRSMKTNKGITMTDGPLWQEQRTFVFKQLSELGFGKDVMNDMIEDSLKNLLKAIGDGGPDVDLSTLLSKSVINILWKLVAGKGIEDEKLTELIRLMKERSKAFDQSGGWLAQMPWLRHIFPSWTGYDIIVKINRQLKQLIQGVITEHKETYKEGITRDFIDAYLQKMYESDSKDSTYTDEQLMMVCLDLFIGGIMTTTSTLDFCFLRLVHHPDVQAKAQVELDTVLGNNLPTVADRINLPYMRALINECFRVTTLVPVNGPRRTLRTTTLGEYVIPKDTAVYMNMASVSMDKERFSEPELFKPERFLDVDDTDDTITANSFPFGFGKRRCPAEVLARNFLFVILAGLLHQYNFNPPYRKPVPTLQGNVGIISTAKPYKLSMAKRIRILSSISNDFRTQKNRTSAGSTTHPY